MQKDYRQAVTKCRDLLDNVSGASVGLELTRETLDALDGLLTEWKGQAVKAAGTLVVGVVKSVATLKVDSALIEGACACACACACVCLRLCPCLHIL